MPDDATLADLVARVPEGWTEVDYAGHRYGLRRSTRAGGRAVAVLARELGGDDLVSANVYLTGAGAQLRACEMPEAKVLHFLRHWSRVTGVSRSRK